MAKNKIRILFDMDGTLCVWNNDATIEEVASPGYFRNLMPHANMIQTVRILIKKGIDVGIYSSTFNDKHSKNDKIFWLETHLPELKKENIIFSTYGEPKRALSPFDILVDDCSEVLHTYDGIAIKLYNGINGNKGTWKGYSIDIKSDANHLANQILAIATMEARLSA